MRAEQKENRRNEIMATALDLFIRRGYGATKIVDIAKAAKMSTGLLFHYFPSKEKLYEELLLQGSQGLEQNIEFDKQNPLDALEKFLDQILEVLAHNEFVSKIFVLVDQAQYLDILPTEIREQLAEGNEFILRTIPLIEAGQANGQIRPGNSEALAVLFWSALQGFAQHKALYPEAQMPQTEWFLSILKA